MSGEQITNNSVETQNLEGDLHSLKNSKKKQRVDINVLKSKLRERENVVLKKNIVILLSCLAIIVIAGISLTYQ